MKSRIRCLLAVMAVVLATACNNKSEPAEPTPTAKPAKPVEPAEPAKPDPCVATCLEENQARATDWEQIKRECENECSKKSGD